MNVHVERSTTIDRARSSVGTARLVASTGAVLRSTSPATKTTYVPSASQSVRTRSSPGLSAPIRGGDSVASAKCVMPWPPIER